MSEDITKDPKYLKDLEKYRTINDTRKFEIELFWKRSLFFWGFISASFLAYVSFNSDKGKNLTLSILISLFGLICSLCWTLVNRGSKYWQENWEQHLNESEGAITGPLFTDKKEVDMNKHWPLRASKYSVSKLTIALSDYIFILWLGLTIYNVGKIQIFINYFENFKCIVINKDLALTYFTIFTFLYVFYVLICTRTTEDKKTNNPSLQHDTKQNESENIK